MGFMLRFPSSSSQSWSRHERVSASKEPGQSIGRADDVTNRLIAKIAETAYHVHAGNWALNLAMVLGL